MNLRRIVLGCLQCLFVGAANAQWVDITNEYLALLNKGDFRGYAQIFEKQDNSAEIILVDTNGTRIYNPNTALKNHHVYVSSFCCR